MMELLEIHTINNDDSWIRFNAKKQHIACIGHVINLAVQEFLGNNGLRSQASMEPIINNVDDVTDDLFRIELDDDNHGESDNDILVEGGEIQAVKRGPNPLGKLRTGVTKI
ncbi:hypothetical protein BGZ82_004791, partial [Podila clonocystis]